MEMNAFEFKTQGEKEVVAASSMFEAIKFYIEFCGCDLDSIDDVEEVPQETWASITVRNMDKEENTEPDTYTLAEMMDGVIEPSIVTTTVY